MNKYEFLKKKGFSKIYIDKIINTYPICNLGDEEIIRYIENTFKYFLNNKELPKNFFYDRHIVGMICRKPNLITYSSEEKDRKLDYYNDRGIDKLKIFKISITYPSIFTISKEKLDGHIKYFEDYGYNDENINKIISSLPQCLGYDLSRLDDVHKFFEEHNYSKEEIISIISRNPKLYSYSDLKLNNTWNTLKEETSFSNDLIKKTTFNCPILFGISNDNLVSKLAVFKYFNLLDVLSKDSNRLIQSAELTYIRGMYFKDLNIFFDKESYGKLFIGRKEFEKQYGVTTEQLKEKYNYEAFIKKNTELKNKKG